MTELIIHECIFCDSILSSQKTLDRHQKTSKKCLIIQKDPKWINKFREKNQLLIKQINNINEIKSLEIKNKNELLYSKDITINSLKEQNNEYKIKIKELELWKETTIKELKMNSITNINSNNINSNNNINNILLYTPDLSRENIKKVCEMINPEILMKEDGLASLFVEQIAKDKDGNYGIINTNKKNICYQFKNKNGEIIKDSNGKKSTAIFTELSRNPIKENLKKVENKKNMDLTDYSEIEENAMNENKLKKNIGIKLHIDNVKNNIIEQDLIKKGEYKESKNEINEQEKLELELKNTRNERINLNEIKIDFDELTIIDQDNSRKYKNDEIHMIKVFYFGKEQTGFKNTTYNIEQGKFIQYIKEDINFKFMLKRNKKIKLLEKQIAKLSNNWYMKKRMKDERNDKIKIGKKLKKMADKERQEDMEEILNDDKNKEEFI